MSSVNSFVADALTYNNHLGYAFSLTDTIATGLASCIRTMKGIKANALQVEFKDVLPR